MDERTQEIIHQTFLMFHELVEGTGFSYQPPIMIPKTSLPYGRCAQWIDWHIEYVPPASGGTLSHELGHMLHETMAIYCQPKKLPAPFCWPEDGEDFAEAIRHFVSKRVGGEVWLPDAAVTLRGCNYDFDVFKRLIRESLTK